MAVEQEEKYMAVIPIRVIPDPVLKEKAKRIRTIDGSVQKLIDDMIETLHDAPGVGLAAPQVGIPLRLIVLNIPEEVEDLAVVNPEVIRCKGERMVDEGCLSIPGYMGKVRRSESVTVKGRDRNGKEIRIKATDLLAQALEHEIDHTNGILYIDRMESRDDLREVQPGEEEEEAD